MKEFLKKVEEFQIASGQPVSKIPTICYESEAKLRYDLMKEENQEYLDANKEMDIVEILDACVDKAYILFGTINQHGIAHLFEKAFNLVHENNMSKVVDGKVIRNLDGKILKPEGFIPVDLEQLFNK